MPSDTALATPPDTLSVAELRATVEAFSTALGAHASVINRLNVYPVPDGDTGTNMARTLDAVVSAVRAAPAELQPTCHAISHGALMGARGNSGVILSQLMRGIASTLGSASDATACVVADALQAAAQGAYSAVLKPVEGTILTVAREAAEAAVTAAGDGASLVETLREARLAGGRALDRTPELLPVLKDAGVVDAGGAGFLLLLDAALHVVAGEPLPEPPALSDLDAPAEARASGAHDAAALTLSGPRYEVMYLLDLADERIEELKETWGRIGDSIVVVGGEGEWNCHVHTDDIGAAIEAAIDAGGRPHSIRVTDLFDEVAEEHARRERSGPVEGVPGSPVGEGLPAVTCAVVAVASGDGLAELFGRLGVQGVVLGGQTLNPSTAELLEAVQRVNAAEVVVLPNNGNIIAVAQQLDALTERSVVVVPTRSMPEALAALVAYDPDATAEDNGLAMAAAASSVATGEVTRAVRDAMSSVGPVRAGDWIGLGRGDGIVSVADSTLAAAVALLDVLVTPEREIVTVIEGADATGAVTAQLREWLDEHRSVHVEVHRGGQPLYPYLFGIE